MARVRFAPLVDEVRGRVGNVVFSDWRGIGTARRYAVSRNPDSSGQQLSRSAFRAGSGVWADANTDADVDPRFPLELPDLWRLYWKHQATVLGGRTGRNAWIGHWLEQTRNFVQADFSPCLVTPGVPAPHNPSIQRQGRTVMVDFRAVSTVPGWSPQIGLVGLLPRDLINRTKSYADWPPGAFGFRAKVTTAFDKGFPVGLPGVYYGFALMGSIRTGQRRIVENVRWSGSEVLTINVT